MSHEKLICEWEKIKPEVTNWVFYPPFLIILDRNVKTFREKVSK